MKKVDGSMWELFRRGTLPKHFFETLEVKRSLRESVERHKEDELLHRANKLAEKFIAGKLDALEQQRAQRDSQRFRRAATEELTDLERLNLKIKYNLIQQPSGPLLQTALRE